MHAEKFIGKFYYSFEMTIEHFLLLLKSFNFANKLLITVCKKKSAIAVYCVMNMTTSMKKFRVTKEQTVD